LKERLISYPIILKPNLSRPFIIYTDASTIALGAVLVQRDEGGEYACQFASRLLKGAESHYTISELECLAMVCAIKLLILYINLTKFTVVTDHIALRWLMTMKEPTGRLARWAIALQAHDMEIVHRSGRKHQNADALSRLIMSMEIAVTDAEEDDSASNLDPYDDDVLGRFLRTGKFEPCTSKQQRKRIQKVAQHYKLQGDTILGHFGINETYLRLKQKFYWRSVLQICTNPAK
jgi:hypothetical protein